MEDRPTRHPYVISETLCDFRSLSDFSYYLLPDFWVYTFRFPIVTKILQNNSK